MPQRVNHGDRSEAALASERFATVLMQAAASIVVAARTTDSCTSTPPTFRIRRMAIQLTSLQR
jgi:hypothetical protein